MDINYSEDEDEKKMRCLFCKKEIGNATSFCPECGQKLEQITQSSKTENYWSEVNKAASQRNEQYKDLVDKTIKERRRINNKFITIVVFVAAITMTAVLGGMKYNDYSNKLIAEMQAQLVGKTLTAHSTHMEGLGWIIHEYSQLTFNDESSLDYAFISTTGPKEEDELPQYEGTYNYTVSRTITGSYKISTDGKVYELKVNDNNEVTGISRK